MFVSRIAFLPSILFSTRIPAEPHAADVLTIVPFLALARELAALFAPVSPRPEFRSNLEGTLIAEARQQAAQFALLPVMVESRDGGDRRWVKGAAAAAAVGSAVSLAGIVVYVLRRRAA
jgi:hypothetical protein